MSKLSIYENSWINLVFEGRNKEYGAYQLRKESDETTLLAFCLGLFFIATLATIPAILNHFSATEKTPIGITDAIDRIITITNIKTPIPKKPIQMALPITKHIKDDIKKDELKNVVIVDSKDANQNIAKNNEKPTNTSDSNIDTETKGITSSTTTTTSGTDTKAPDTNDVDPKATFALDKLPEFPGGIKKFYAFVGSNFEKPELDEVKTVKVYVSFVIEKDGSMTDIQVRRDPGYGLGKEAIRVLKSLKTKWEPGLIAGTPVRTAYTLPIVVEMK
jgi:Gram-negative bacterial TonB protein C-terminal